MTFIDPGSDLVDVGEHAEQVPLLTLLGQDPGQRLDVPAALHRVPPRVETGHSRVRDDKISVAWYLQGRTKQWKVGFENFIPCI